MASIFETDETINVIEGCVGFAHVPMFAMLCWHLYYHNPRVNPNHKSSPWLIQFPALAAVGLGMFHASQIFYYYDPANTVWGCKLMIMLFRCVCDNV